MKLVGGFPQCRETLSGKFIWNEGDSIYGVDVPVWKQFEYDVDCADDEDCVSYCRSNYNGEFVHGKLGKKCYSYRVLLNTIIYVLILGIE